MGIEREIVTGNVEELWSFMPTDFLKELNYITHPANIHRFMVDGSPAIYHLDLPASSGGIGDGIVDANERAIVVFGLGKGGRSYYALNIQDPFNPKMQWTVVPDEANAFPAARIEPGSDTNVNEVRNILAKWGFSSATPAFGRIVYAGATKQIKDAVFLSGGFSVPEIDAKFPDTRGNPTPLGRSVMALDVWTGNVLAAVDLAEEFGSSVGPVGAGVIPFEFIVNSGAAQRAYFTDYNGGLWVWGANETITDSRSIYQYFREDTSEIKKWGLRKIYQDTSATGNRRYTTSPAPFRVGAFPGNSRSGAIKPAAAAIAMVSGDRNNPLDYRYSSASNPSPANHRLTVVFDRQDSKAWENANGVQNGVITDLALANFSTNNVNITPANFCTDNVFRFVTPGCDDYYLAPRTGDPKFGYYINFGPMSGGFIPKGINPPTVVSGSLFYTVFAPESADPCAGGLGKSTSWVIADAINPLREDNRRDTGDAALYSHIINDWGGVASNFIQLGTRGVIQGGVPAGGADGAALEIRTTAADPSQGYPKPRVWRVIRQ